MNYEETLSYLYAQLPMFTRTGISAYKKDLQNILLLTTYLQHPQKNFKTIHVAGTNGKGSVSHMLSAIFQSAGYKTGLYTSPHLKDFRERIKINGEMMSENDVVQFINLHKNFIEKISPSFFELTVAMAFNFFNQQKVDIAIIEVGLGGRLDSTNIIQPELSIITNIGFDHVDILGNTLALIASEKAGIIKRNTPIVIGEYHQETKPIFIKKSEVENAPLYFASNFFKVKTIETSHTYQFLDVEDLKCKKKFELNIDLTGLYQTKNVATVLTAVEILNSIGINLTMNKVFDGLKNVKKLTGFAGRWHVHQKNPLIISDTGHNEDGIIEVLKNINNQSYEKLHFVLGMLKDKDSGKILQMLPKNAEYYFCAPNLPRAKPVQLLSKEALQFGLIGKEYNSVQDALNAAKNSASKNDFIFIGGSTFVVAEVM